MLSWEGVHRLLCSTAGQSMAQMPSHLFLIVRGPSRDHHSQPDQCCRRGYCPAGLASGVSCYFPLFSEILLERRGHIRTQSEKTDVTVHGPTRHEILSSPSVGHTGQPNPKQVTSPWAALAYGKMHQDDRFTALFKGVGSYWYHFSSQIIKSSVVGKGSEVHLVTRMLDELGGQNFSFS